MAVVDWARLMGTFSHDIEKQAYRVSEAVYAYGLSRSHLYRLVSDGTLKVAKVGSVVLIPRAELDALLIGPSEPPSESAPVSMEMG